MQVTRSNLSDTKIKLTLVADQKQLDTAKRQTLKALSKDIKLPGFRQGKVPLELVEKNANPSLMQQDFMERAMNAMYGQALDEERLRPVAQPQVSVTKFVPFTTLEIEAEVDVIGQIKLMDYKKAKLAKEAPTVTAEDVKAVIKQLQTREAERKDVDRAAKDGDQVVIDFAGVDAKDGAPINGADGTNYPLVLGSNSFIPGFEPNMIGMKAGEEKAFDITFPEDYGVESLQKRKVTFTVKVHTVQEVVEPKADDEFAAKIGPFKSLDELKSDIKKQLEVEKQNQANRDYEEQLLNLVADKSEAAIPDSLVEAEIARMEASERQDLGYRGQTWQEHLEAEGVTEEEHREKNREQATRRVKAGLVLAEVAEKEGVDVTKEELDLRLQLLKGQYQDAAMQAELDKAENRREIASRLLTEKTVAKLVGYATANSK
jgi:trigger factor